MAAAECRHAALRRRNEAEKRLASHRATSSLTQIGEFGKAARRLEAGPRDAGGHHGV